MVPSALAVVVRLKISRLALSLQAAARIHAHGCLHGLDDGAQGSARPRMIRLTAQIEIYSLLVCRQLGVAQQLPVYKPTTSAWASASLQSPEDRFAAFLDASTVPAPATVDDGTAGLDPKLCRANTKVQRAVAQLIVTLGLAMGILSSLTTSYWGPPLLSCSSLTIQAGCPIALAAYGSSRSH